MEFGDASGRAEVIEKLLRDLGNAGGLGLARDGSTNIGDLLSVSRLSIPSSGWNRSQPSTNDGAKHTSVQTRSVLNLQ